MRTRPGLLGQLVVSLLIVAGAGLWHCHGASSEVVEVTGVGECADCLLNNIKTSHAFSGLGVTIDCKLADGELKRIGSGELDDQGKFKVALPNEMLSQSEDGLMKLKEECYAQLHGASGIPCSLHNNNGIESSKIIFTGSNEPADDDGNGKLVTFSPSGKLRFSSETCTSAFLWPHYKYPPLPKKKPCPPFFKKPLPPHVPIYKKPLLPPVPVYKKPVPVYKKPLPPVPIYKKPLPKFPPIYKKPLPPIYKKPFPHLPKFPPLYKKKPIPSLPKFPPLYKKPCPPIIPKIPPN